MSLSNLQQKEINLTKRNYKEISDLGYGSFGFVKLVQHIKTKNIFAIKIIPKNKKLKNKLTSHQENEIKIMKQLNNPYFINFHEVFLDKNYIYIVMDFIKGCELFNLLQKQIKLQENKAQFYIAQVVIMIDYLHDKNIIYRDLKPENLLITKNGYLKLIDFGLSKQISRRTYTICGTPEYLAPEILLQKGHGKPVDWWCLGVLMYELIVGFTPYQDEDPMNIYQMIVNDKVTFPKHVSRFAKDLMKNLMQKNLDKRFGNLQEGSYQIQNHIFFNRMDWYQLKNKKFQLHIHLQQKIVKNMK